MNKRIGWGVVVAVALLVASPIPSQAHGQVPVGVTVPPGVGPEGWGAPSPDSGYSDVPAVVVAQAPRPTYWYYCPNPSGYYPYVKECPPGWMTVAPSPTGQPGPQPTPPLGGPGAPPQSAGPPGTSAPPPSTFTHQVPFLTLVLSHGQELGLTPDQLQKLQELGMTFDKETVARGQTIQAAQGALNALVAQDQWDLPAIDAKVHEVATLQADQQFAAIKAVAAWEALLTPAQLQKFDAIERRTPPPGGPAAPLPRPPASSGGPPPPAQ